MTIVSDAYIEPGEAGTINTDLPGDHVKNPSVSVVVTNYNYQDYLPACLDSIANQSYKDFECVIVDDVSTDNSVTVVQDFINSHESDKRFELVSHEQNQGQMGAFKTGLSHTTGSFVIFVDAVDVLLPDFIDTHLKTHLNASYSVAFTCSDQIQIGDDGEIISGTYPKIYSKRGGYGRDVLYGLPSYFNWKFNDGGAVELEQSARKPIYLPAVSGYVSAWFWSTTSAMMYRRATLELVLSEDCDKFRICADYYLVTFAQAIGGSIIIPTVHGCYRQHGKNGFAQGSVIGGEHPPGNHLVHPAYGQFNLSFVRHALENFEQFAILLGLARAHMLIARFAPKKLFRKLVFRKLLLRRRIDSENMIEPLTLVRYRIAWRLFKSYCLLSHRIKVMRRIVASKQ